MSPTAVSPQHALRRWVAQRTIRVTVVLCVVVLVRFVLRWSGLGRG